MIKPPPLKKGDKIAITCPAKKLDKTMDDAIKLIQSWGLEVVIGETLSTSYHQFAGTDEFRAKEFQEFINDTSIKAIFAARGGYGCIRIVDHIDFTPLLKNPKWIVGFSDITVLHSQLHCLGIQSIHGQMPATITESSFDGIESLRKALFGEEIIYHIKPHFLNKIGEAEGQLIGGNLSLLVAQLQSKTDFNFDGKILFIEDVGEYLYAVDRLIRTLNRANKLSKLKALIVGGFTSLKDNDIPFGFTAQQIIYEVVKNYDYPVIFDFPAGHLKDNRALILGGNCEIIITEEIAILKRKS